MSGIQSMLAPAGPISGWLAWLWWLFFWISLAVYVATLVPLLYWVWKSRRVTDSAPASSRRKVRVVGFAVGITSVILLAFIGVSAAIGGRISDVHA